MKIDTERVIAEVHSRPLLWDKSDEFYKNKQARDAAWQEISMELLPNYQYLSLEAKREVDKKIQQRWRTARDTYKKDKIAEKNHPGRKRKRYAYYDMITFLDSVLMQNDDPERPDNIVEAQLEESSMDAVIWISTPSPSNPAPPPPPPEPPRDLAVSSPEQPSSQQPKNKKKVPVDFEQRLLDYLKSSQLELESDDMAFFQSLQPNLKRFNNHQKMLFRTKVMQIVMEIENPGGQILGTSSNIIESSADYEDPSSIANTDGSGPQYDDLPAFNSGAIKSEVTVYDNVPNESDMSFNNNIGIKMEKCVVDASTIC